MSDTAIAFPRISREVLDEITIERTGGCYALSPSRFRLEQPDLFDVVIDQCHSDTETAMRLASMEFIYEALQRQMRRGQ